MKPIFVMTNETLTIMWEGACMAFNKSALNFKPLRLALIEERWADVPGLLTPTGMLEAWSQGAITQELVAPAAEVATEAVPADTSAWNDEDMAEELQEVQPAAATADEIMPLAGTGPEISRTSYQGERVAAPLIERAQVMAAEGHSSTAFKNFMDRLAMNPSRNSREQLERFLKHSGIPFEESGHFLAYKSVRRDLRDHHSGSFVNSVGAFITMPRNAVVDDPHNACGPGLHVGSLGYVSGTYGSGVVVICRVDPMDVVSVPLDYGSAKMRVCHYEVVGFHNGEEMTSSVMDPDDMPRCMHDEYDGDEDEYYDEDDEDTDPLAGMDDFCATQVAPPGDDVDDDDGEDAADYCDDSDYDDEDGYLLRLAEPTVVEQEAVAETKPKRASPAKPAAKAKAPKAKDIHKAGQVELMSYSIEDLRKYAAGKLKIVGASKIRGGKTAVVDAILRVRQAGK